MKRLASIALVCLLLLAIPAWALTIITLAPGVDTFNVTWTASTGNVFGYEVWGQRGSQQLKYLGSSTGTNLEVPVAVGEVWVFQVLPLSKAQDGTLIRGAFAAPSDSFQFVASAPVPLRVQPLSIAVTIPQGAAAQSQSLNVFGGGAYNVNCVVSATNATPIVCPAWLSTSPTGGNNAGVASYPDIIGVDLATAPLAAGTYSAELGVLPTVGTPVLISVTLTVNAPPSAPSGVGGSSP